MDERFRTPVELHSPEGRVISLDALSNARKGIELLDQVASMADKVYVTFIPWIECSPCHEILGAICSPGGGSIYLGHFGNSVALCVAVSQSCQTL